MPNTATADSVTQFSLAMAKALGADTVERAVRQVKKAELPLRAQFDRALRKTSAGSLERLRYLCEIARSKPAPAKVANAQKALLDFFLRNRDSIGKKLTRDEVLVLSTYYKLHLGGVKADLLGRAPAAWGTTEAVFDYVEALEGKIELKANNH